MHESCFVYRTLLYNDLLLNPSVPHKPQTGNIEIAREMNSL